MRDRLGVAAAVLALLSASCGGGRSGTALPADTLDHDAAGLFQGLWYGTGTMRALGSAHQSSGYIRAEVTGRNQLSFRDFCGDHGGPAARVTSDADVVIGSYSCPLPTASCTMTWDIQGGTGHLMGEAFTFSMKGRLSGCGYPATDLTFQFTGTRSPDGASDPSDHGSPSATLAAASAGMQPGVPIVLDASGSSDPDGRPLTFAWSVAQQPTGGDAALTPTAANATATFVAHVQGTYTVQVIVTASDGQSATASLTLSVFAAATAMTPLAHGVADAAYDAALERIIMVDGGTNALYVHDPATGAETSVALPLPPQCLSVSLDGAHALVGHNAWISYVDLRTPRIEKSIPTAVDAGACTLGSGFAYVFPKDDWFSVHSIDLATNVETGGSRPYDGSRGVLTPDGKTLYAVTANQSPMDLKRWDVSNGAAAFAWQMAYHGDYPVGDRIWMERSGARVFTSAGTAFRVSSVQAQDMIYAGALSGLTSVTHLDSSAAEIAAIPATSWWDPGAAAADTSVELFNTTYLGHVDRIALPAWTVGQKIFGTHGRFVFYSADGSKKFVMVQADPSAGLLRDWSVLTYVGTELVGSPDVADHGPPSAVIQPTSGTRPGVALTLDASASSDPDERALAFAWAVAERPPGASVTLSGSTTAWPVFTADQDGSYRLQLTVTAEDGQGATASLFVNVSSGALVALPHEVAQAEYSRALERLVMTDGSPSALYVYDPATGVEAGVPLPLAPQCLGLSPDGRFAVVGHNAWISYVDLANRVLVKTIPISADVGDCVLAGNGWAYLFPRVDQWVALHSVEVATGVEVTTSSWSVYAGARARLHPSGDRIYSITTQLSPRDLERWSISGGAAAYAWDSPYHGDYAMGPNLWISLDGARIFTAAGTAFRTSSIQSQDMTYGGALSDVGAVTHLDTSATEIAAIPAPSTWDPSTANRDTAVELFETTYLGHAGRITLPSWTVGSTAYATHGRFVFYSADGSRKHVVLQADRSSGLLHDTAVVTF